jgi:hypothetical protein
MNKRKKPVSNEQPVTQPAAVLAVEKAVAKVVPPPKKDDVLRATAIAVAEVEQGELMKLAKEREALMAQRETARQELRAKTESFIKDALSKVPGLSFCHMADYHAGGAFARFQIEYSGVPELKALAEQEQERRREVERVTGLMRQPRSPEKIYQQLKQKEKDAPVEALLSDPDIRNKLVEAGLSILRTPTVEEKVSATNV